MPKKWIQAKIDSLDPEVDYVEIWKLSSSYGGNAFMSSLSYAITFQNFIVTEWGSEVIWREDGGKVLERPYGRAEQTEGANFLWWQYGPHDERTKKSVDGINRLHAFWAKKFPGRFAYNDDYVYVAAYTAIGVHRFQLTMGAPGFTEKQQIAAHKFWGEMAKLFYAEDHTPLHGYPADFAGLIAFCEEYEGRSRPKPERTNLIVTAFHQQFAESYFPKNLEWLGHQLLRAFSVPSTLETAQIDPPLPMAKDLLPKLVGLVLWHQNEFEDDPEMTYLEELQQLSPEEKSQRRASIRDRDKGFASRFVADYADDPKFAGCPFHAALKTVAPLIEPSPPTEVLELERVSYPHTH